jgi:hypothetical protein
MHISGHARCKSNHALGATHPYAGFSPLINQWKMRWFLIEINSKIPIRYMGTKKVAGYQEAMRTIAVRLY